MKQQDSHEALTFILDNLHVELNTNAEKVDYKEEGPKFAILAFKEHITRESSFMWSLFGGQLESKLICTSCNNASTTFDHFTSLSLEIPTQPSDIYQVLNSFTNNSDILEWNCDNWENVSHSSRTFRISKLPRVLILHLKRFIFNMNGDRRKIRTSISYPLLDLDMSPYVAEEIPDMCCQYDLFAISNHIGELNSGHYTSYVQHGGDWYHCNDSSTKKANVSDLINSGTYILFYKRKDIAFL